MPITQPDYGDIRDFAKARRPLEPVIINAIPPGFSAYRTGVGDAVTASPGYGTGADLLFTASNKTARFQMLGHWFAFGGEVIWEGADLADSMYATLVAPATVGTNAAGDFNKVATGLGCNIYVPASPGGGAWSLDLTAKHTGTQVLKCTPVPSIGNNGYFDYDPVTNVLSVNSGATGSHNLLDADWDLFAFARKCRGKATGGLSTIVLTPNLVGKLLFNSWVIDFELVTAKTEGIAVGIEMLTGVKGNV